MNKFIPFGLLLISFAGFLDAAYLFAKHVKGEIPDCVLFAGCDTVTSSAYATIGPVPVSLLGMLFYLSVFFLVIAYFSSYNRHFLKLVLYLSLPAVIFSGYLVFLQAFVIDAFCVYCMFSAFTSCLVCLLAFFVKKDNPSA